MNLQIENFARDLGICESTQVNLIFQYLMSESSLNKIAYFMEFGDKMSMCITGYIVYFILMNIKQTVQYRDCSEYCLITYFGNY